jgi:hypothetical protein
LFSGVTRCIFGFGQIKFTFEDTFQKEAFERAATGRPGRINAAKITLIETGAGLSQAMLLSLALELEAGSLKSFGIIAGLQFDIAKQNAVTAKGTAGAELTDDSLRLDWRFGNGLYAH